MITARKLIPPEALPGFGIKLSNKQRKRLEVVGQFPKRVPLTARTHAYILDEILEYGESRIRERDARVAHEAGTELSLP